MQRIDVASASATLPIPAALGTPGYFTDGDVVAGAPATIVEADWLNMVQEELVKVVLAGGGTLSKTNRAQLLAAIIALIVGGTGGTIAAEGSISVAGGLLVLKWGTATIPTIAAATNSVAHLFPTPFPQACFGVFGSPRAATVAVGWNPITHFIPLEDVNGFTVVIDSTDPGHNILQAVPFFYVALGN